MSDGQDSGIRLFDGGGNVGFLLGTVLLVGVVLFALLVAGGSIGSGSPNETTAPETESGALENDSSGAVTPANTLQVAGANGSEIASEGSDARLEIRAASDSEALSYTFVVDGTIEKAQAGEGVSADEDDSIREHDNGTVTVTGSTTAGSGDAYVFNGTIRSSAVSGGDYEARLVRDIDQGPADGDETGGGAVEDETGDDDDETADEPRSGGEGEGEEGDDDEAGDTGGAGADDSGGGEDGAQTGDGGQSEDDEQEGNGGTGDDVGESDDGQGDDGGTGDDPGETNDGQEDDDGDGDDPGETDDGQEDDGGDDDGDGDDPGESDDGQEDDDEDSDDGPGDGAGDADRSTTSVTSCRTVTESGVYDVQADLRASSGPCLHVTTSDVTIDGNGHTIAGDGAPESDQIDDSDSGIWIFDDDNPRTGRLENVTVRDVQVRGWSAGIRSGIGFSHGATISIEDAVLAENRVGISFSESDDATVSDVVIEDNDNGLRTLETIDVRLRSSTVRNNEESGVFAGQASPISVVDTTITGNGEEGMVESNEGAETLLDNVTIADNGGHGFAQRNDVSNTVIVGSTIRNNGGAGIDSRRSSWPNTIRDVTIAGNQGDGISIDSNGVLAQETGLENVTVRDNGGLEIDARGGLSSATDLQVGPSATFAFQRESPVIEPFDSADLTSLPDNATAVGPGLNVTSLEGPVRMAVARTMDGSVDGQLQLVRRDGASWTVVGTADDAGPADSVEAEITTGGIFALVEVDE